MKGPDTEMTGQNQRSSGGWREWKEARPAGHTTIRFRTDGSQEWRTVRVDSNREEELLAATADGVLEVRNDGPEIVTIDGRYERTEFFNGDETNPWEIKGRTLCGSLAAGESSRWRIGDERIVATARTECFMVDRTEYLRMRRSKKGRRSGKSGEELFAHLFRVRGVEAECIVARGHGVPTPDFRVRANGLETVWEVKTLIDEQPDVLGDSYSTGADDRTLSNVADKAARQLMNHAGAGVPTVLGLVNLRGYDPNAIQGDELALLLYGQVEAGIDQEKGTGLTTGRIPNRDRGYRHISAIAALEFHVANPPSKERGRRYSDFAQNTAMIGVSKVFVNTEAVVPLKPEDLTRLRASWMSWTTAPGREVLVSTCKTHEEWDGFMDIAPKDDSTMGMVAAGMKEIREEMRRQVREGKVDWIGDDGRMAADRRSVLLRSEPLRCEETWTRYVVEDAEKPWTARIAGSRTKVTEVLGLVAGQVPYKEIAGKIESGSLPVDDDCIAVRAAAAYAGTVVNEGRNLPPDSDEIERVPGRCGGAPVLKNTRLRVTGVFDGIESGMSVNEIARDWEAQVDLVLAAVRYGLDAVLKHENREQRSVGP